MRFGPGTMIEALDIEVTEIGHESVSGRLPIGPKTIQSANLLHGGASVSLAETIGSVGSFMIIDPEIHYPGGQSITANHLRPGLKGFANALAKTDRKRKTSHVWDVDISDDDGKLLCVCRLTMAIVAK